MVSPVNLTQPNLQTVDPSRGYTIPTVAQPATNSSFALAGLALTTVVFGGCFKASPVANPHEAATISREECVAMNTQNSQTSALTAGGVCLVVGLLGREIVRGISKLVRWAYNKT